MEPFNVFTAIRDRARDFHQVESSIVPQMQADDDFDNTEARNVWDAIHQYNRDRPRQLTSYVVANTTQAYEYLMTDIVPDWDPEHYNVLDIQADLCTASGSSSMNATEIFMGRNDWRVTRDPTTGAVVLRLQTGTLGNPFVVWYQAPHIFRRDPGLPNADPPVAPDSTMDFSFAPAAAASPLTYTNCTIPLAEISPLARLVGSYALLQAANFYSKKNQVQSYQADTVNYKMVAKELRDASKEAEEYYKKHIISLPQGTTGISVTWETRPRGDGGGWLIHSRDSWSAR